MTPDPSTSTRNELRARTRNPKPALTLVASLLALSAACGGQTATLSFELVFPPGTDRLPAEAVTARLTLDETGAVTEAPIAADGSFSLALEVPADGTTSAITFEALDAAGAVLVRGHSPPVPLALYQDTLRLYVAPPGRFSEAPFTLDPPRSFLGVAPLSYGFLIAGGIINYSPGQLDDSLSIYSVYLHELTPGEDLPEARADMAAATGDFGIVYLIGGRTLAGTTGDILRFDTNAPPDGDYTTVGATLQTLDGEAAGIGGDAFVVTAPNEWAHLFDGGAGTVAQMSDATYGTQSATTTIDAEGHIVVILIGPGGIALHDATAGETTELDVGAGADQFRSDHVAVRLPGGDVLAIGGVGAGSLTLADTAILVTPEGATSRPPLLATPRRFAAAAVTGDLLVVAGGFDDAGQAIADAELFDVNTLAPRGTVPLVTPRGYARALTMPNGDVLLIGGEDNAGGVPVGTVEFFTP